MTQQKTPAQSIHDWLRKGPLLVGEVRGFKSEVGKKFDKSDKNAPPIVFGVFKIHLELLGDGSPVSVSLYPDKDVDTDKWALELGLQRGTIAAVLVTKSEFKDGQRMVRCSMDGIRVLSAEEAKELLVA